MLEQSNAEPLPNGGTAGHEQLQSKDGPNLNVVVCQSSRERALLISSKPYLRPGIRNFEEVMAAQELASSDLQASPMSAMPVECRSHSVPARMHVGASLLSGEMDGLKVQPRAARRSLTLRLGLRF